LIKINATRPASSNMRSSLEHIRILVSRALWYASPMNLIPGIGRLLSLLAITGLVLLPLARPAMALTGGTHEVMHHHAAADIPHDHSCCPTNAPASHCDVDCLAICAAQILLNAMSGPAAGCQLGLVALLLPHNDAGAEGLKKRPPPRPPKL
jgi:hypothetical protein